MRKILGLLMVLAGVALGVYIGFVVLFIGGIVGIIELIQSGTVTTGAVAWQALKILFAGAVGAISFWALALPGFVMIAGGGVKRSHRKPRRR